MYLEYKTTEYQKTKPIIFNGREFFFMRTEFIYDDCGNLIDEVEYWGDIFEIENEAD